MVYIQLNVAVPSSDLCEQLIVQNSSGSCACTSQYLSTIKPSVGNYTYGGGKVEMHENCMPQLIIQIIVNRHHT
jgi:hypothetical protein